MTLPLIKLIIRLIRKEKVNNWLKDKIKEKKDNFRKVIINNL